MVISDVFVTSGVKPIGLLVDLSFKHLSLLPWQMSLRQSKNCHTAAILNFYHSGALFSLNTNSVLLQTSHRFNQSYSGCLSGTRLALLLFNSKSSEVFFFFNVFLHFFYILFVFFQLQSNNRSS